MIDWRHPSIKSLALELGGVGLGDETAALRCFEWVRDEIRHSSDYKLNPVTCAASEVLEHRTGYCYAKSHLLCALLRACGVPSGLAYQRLHIDGPETPYCLHGLCAVHLRNHGWYRVDPRGNREDVDAQFCPPQEQLAFATELPGECDVPGVFAKPLPSVVEVLRNSKTWDAVLDDLPDWPGA